jgi:hypothetical protein
MILFFLAFRDDAKSAEGKETKSAENMASN